MAKACERQSGSPVCIGCLARAYRQDPTAQLALRLAWESSDPDIRTAATGVTEDQ